MTKTKKTKDSDEAVEESEVVRPPPIVLNNTQGPRIIPFGGVSSDDGTSVIDLERMKFHAGLNAPKDPSEFAKVSALPSYKQWVKQGVLEELESLDEIPVVGKADDVIIEASASRSSMEWWLAHETRSSVRTKLKTKLAEMKKQRFPQED